MIDSVTLLAMLGGGLAGAGIFALIEALIGRPPVASDDARPGRLSRESLTAIGPQIGVGAAAAVITLVLTQWVVAGIAGFLLGYFGNSLLGGTRHAKVEMERLEALATWTESLRDTIAGAVGLEQAIPATYNATPPVLRGPLGLLIDRLRTREPLPGALMRFADDLDDPSADLIIAALVLNARLRGPGLRDVLGALSAAAREELDIRQRIDASRRSTRRSVQIIVGLTLTVVLGLTLLNRSYVEPYSGFAGQVVLGLVFALFGGGFLWLRRLAHFDVPGRFLTGRLASGSLPPGVVPEEQR
ncbi:MAG: type II secretion system protein [Actinobacteria bacterium]|nr:type II secretion system protein [Actinomycetota bacterium]MBI3688036.1 type II secretion system protein [Actinomycetota bacterium]